MSLLAVVALTATLSERYFRQLDWTQAGRNTLSETSRALLTRMHSPLKISAYARPNEVMRRSVEILVERYRRHKRDIELRFVNPDLVPDEVRRLGIKTNGELVVEYLDNREHVVRLNESALTNALHSVTRTGHRWLAYLSGHDERDWLGGARHDLGTWGAELQSQGFKLQPLNLHQIHGVPDNTAVLGIFGPQSAVGADELGTLARFCHQRLDDA